jgi:hypothetical protein
MGMQHLKSGLRLEGEVKSMRIPYAGTMKRRYRCCNVGHTHCLLSMDLWAFQNWLKKGGINNQKWVRNGHGLYQLKS